MKVSPTTTATTRSLTLLLLSAPLGSAFLSVGGPAPSSLSSSSSTSLDASRKATKTAKKLEWLEKRGISTIDEENDDGTAKTALLKNDDGLEYLRLTSGDGSSTADVYPYGGVVTSYVKDSTEFIAVRPDAKMDGSKPISGGLSHCWPQFGPGEIQQHGFARNVNWDVVSSSENSVELEMKPSEYTKEMWDKPFSCRFAVELSDEDLKTTMTVKNTADGEEASSFDFQSALHSYFTVSSLKNLEIEGSFKDKEFLNKLVGENGEMQKEDRSTITISEEYDRVYKGVNDPVLKDSGTKKMLKVQNEKGYDDTVLWNPYGNEGMGYDNFVCVESVKFDPVTLPAGDAWEGILVLKPESL